MAALLGTCRGQVGDNVAILISGEHYDGNIVPGDRGELAGILQKMDFEI